MFSLLLQRSRKTIIALLLIAGSLAFLPQCASNESVVLMYRSAENLRGDFGFAYCSTASNIPRAASSSNGYTGHTFYGSTDAMPNGSFNRLPARIGITTTTSLGLGITLDYEVRYAKDTQVFAPEPPVTLSSLLALNSTGDYENTEDIKRLFSLVDDENPSTPFPPSSGGFEYYTFTDAEGNYSPEHSCNGATRSDSTNILGDAAYIALHSGTNHKLGGRSVSHNYIGTGYGCDVAPNINRYVLCLARKKQLCEWPLFCANEEQEE